METKSLVCGAWALVLLGAVGIATWRMGTPPGLAIEAEPVTRASEARPPGAVTSGIVQPAAFTQQKTPGRLPVVSDSDPLADTKLKALRRIVAEEMPGASDEEKDIWTEQFRDLPEDTVRFLLRQKRTSDGNSKHIATVPASPAEVAMAEPHDPQSSTIAAIQRARQILRANVLNAATTGYRRQLVEFHGTSQNGIAGLEIAEVRWQMSPGPLTQTGRMFDLSIPGRGLFAVSSGDETFFTRAGRFRLNASRKLVLPLATQELTLLGVEPIPAEAEEVSVAADGTVTATTDQAAVDLGRVRVAQFLDPSRMQSSGGCLFQPTQASGPPNYTGPFAVQQGWIEGSNANQSLEAAFLKQLEHWETLPGMH